MSTQSETPITDIPTQPPPSAKPGTLPSSAPLCIGVLGTVDTLSEAEQFELSACEGVISAGWHSFAEVGLALGQIRDGKLYRLEFNTFEEYCRRRWGYHKSYVYSLVFAAQVFTHLSANRGLLPPEHEFQLRPLNGLSLEQAQAVWERATENAAGHRVTAQIVKRARTELKLAPPPKPVSSETCQTRVAKRQTIDDVIGELLKLLSQKAPHELLTEKVEILHQQINALLPKVRRKQHQ